MKTDGSKVRLIAHLIRVQDQVHVWANTYDRQDFSLGVQADIAESIASAVARTLAPSSPATTLLTSRWLRAHTKLCALLDCQSRCGDVFLAQEEVMSVLRRTFLSLAPILPLVSTASLRQGAVSNTVPSTFPSHDPEVSREMVAVSHGNVARVRELLSNRPALANASWDWGYGDWESALGAASHVGNQEIARLLLAAGARPTIFSAAMLGQVETVRAFVAASPGVQKTRGPHGLTLLSHARAGGAAAADVVKFLESVGDADPRYTNEPLTDGDRTAIAGSLRIRPRADRTADGGHWGARTEHSA